MAGLDITIVREYFELNGFLVRQLRKHQLQKRSTTIKRSEEEIDLIVSNPRAKKNADELNFMMFSSDLPNVSRAIVSVKGWHTTRFSAAMLRSSADIFNFLEKDVLKKAEELFSIDPENREGLGPMKKILVLPGLPTQGPRRAQSIELLREHGVDAVLSFRAMLQDIISKIEVNHNYEKSDLLQTLRILKNYDMIQANQMELFAKKRES